MKSLTIQRQSSNHLKFLQAKVTNTNWIQACTESKHNLESKQRLKINPCTSTLQKFNFLSLHRLSLEEREFLWEKRFFLYNHPDALAKVLQCVPRWDFLSLQETYTMIQDWAPLNPIQAVELLLPWYVFFNYDKTKVLTYHFLIFSS